MIFSLSSAATRDVERLRQFLLPANPSAAIRAMSRIIQSIRSLERFPEKGRPVGDDGARDLIVPFGRSGYIVRYLYLRGQNKIVVQRIWHGLEDRT